MIYDFHTHTYLSDGILSPMELIRTAHVQDYGVIAVTDHVGLEDQERVIKTLLGECRRAMEAWGIVALAGVEITHVPKRLIGEAAQKAKDLGAQIVLVHGETIVEPVEPGSNLAALGSSNVDILAHPGLITEEEASKAAEMGIFLEISTRRGHSLTNGHVAKVGLGGGAKLLIDSDTHRPEDLLNVELIMKVAKGAGLSGDEASTLIESNPPELLKRTG
jgi:histidinol phosphatase-like PHP family hydrolase